MKSLFLVGLVATILIGFLMKNKEICGLNSAPYASPVIALELFTDTDDVHRLLSGKPEEVKALRDNILYDFAFIFSYGLLLIGLVHLLFEARGVLSGLFRWGILIACVADMIENLCQLRIIDSFSSSYAQMLPILNKATNLKWILIFLIISGMAFMLLRRPRHRVARISAWLVLVTSILSCVAFLSFPHINLNIMALAELVILWHMAMLLALLLFELVRLIKWIRREVLTRE